MATSACQTHEQKARAKLEAMGVAYSERGFLQKVQEGDNTAIQLFLAAGMQQNKPALQRALFLAVPHGKAGVARELIASGADVNANSGHVFRTLLMNAITNGNTEVARELITSGADVNAKAFGGETALLVAVGVRNAVIVHELIAHGADVNAKDNDGMTALRLAKQLGVAEVVRELQRAGAKE
ncbi:MAG: ankyrin repeat domain-containing protein [Candidatus Binatus sp.]|uniref:ankyrin repeat domain-containing protein n=1 Tax=Candidatus Binatus sp. TaxID=2811406 RepID=UPI003C74A588